MINPLEQRDRFLQELERIFSEYGYVPRGTYTLELVFAYYLEVIEENNVQNLTRITEYKDFIQENVVDSLFLLKEADAEWGLADLGSGFGVPGLLCKILDHDDLRRWVLCESEKRKAAFLRRTATRLGLEVEVSALRVETYLKQAEIQALTARALGSIEKIYELVRKCSTWNTLYLLKGPKWTEEFSVFRKKFDGKLSISNVRSYTVGEEKKNRNLVVLRRQ